jgi:Mg/Co/Ni transporter MgtE
LRRRHSGRLAGWDVLLPFFTGITLVTQQTAEIRDLHPAEAAEHFAAMPVNERVAIADALDNEELADLLGELPESEQVAVIEGLDVERAADVIEEMEPDDAADLLAEMAPEEREEVLLAMDPEEAGSLRRLLQYSPNTAGGLMNPEPLVLGADATVAEALAHIRDPDLPAAEAAHVFVCEPPLETPSGRYLGPVGYQRLLREPPSTALGHCLDEDPRPISADLTIVEVARRLASYDVVAVPVCDVHGRLLGAVSVDDVLDHLLPVGWRRR